MKVQKTPKAELIEKILSMKEYKGTKYSTLYKMKIEDLEKLASGAHKGPVKIKRKTNYFSVKREAVEERIEVFRQFANGEISTKEVSEMLKCDPLNWYPQYKQWKDKYGRKN